MLETFTDILGSAVTGALAYIGAAVAAGAVIFAVWVGIRVGLKAVRTTAYNDYQESEWDEIVRKSEVVDGRDGWGNEYCSCGYVLGSAGCASNH